MGSLAPPLSELHSQLYEISSTRCVSVCCGKAILHICRSATHSGRRSDFKISILCTPAIHPFVEWVCIQYCSRRLSNISRPDILDLHVIQYSKTWKWEIGGSTHRNYTPPNTHSVLCEFSISFIVCKRFACEAGPNRFQSGLKTGELLQPRLLCNERRIDFLFHFCHFYAALFNYSISYMIF